MLLLVLLLSIEEVCDVLDWFANLLFATEAADVFYEWLDRVMP